MDVEVLTKLVRELLPDVTQREIRHFVVMVWRCRLNPGWIQVEPTLTPLGFNS